MGDWVINGRSDYLPVALKPFSQSRPIFSWAGSKYGQSGKRDVRSQGQQTQPDCVIDGNMAVSEPLHWEALRLLPGPLSPDVKEPVLRVGRCRLQCSAIVEAAVTNKPHAPTALVNTTHCQSGVSTGYRAHLQTEAACPFQLFQHFSKHFGALVAPLLPGA